jgi:bacterioferritin-associated ferredoxin
MQTSVCSPDDCRTCDDRVVCRCLQVTEEQVVFAITTLEVRNLRELRQTTGAGDGCTACHRKLKALLQEHVYSDSEAMCLVG